MSRPTIAVVTPVLNEAAHVERWAESSRCADFLLMLDTGSDDSTPELAKSCGIEVHSAVFAPFRFDDARNMAAALVPPSIDIVIQLDGDEVFAEPNWRRHIDANADGHSRWSYWLDNMGGGDWGRVQRSNCVRRVGYRWEHPVHEVIVGKKATCHLDELVIEHRPDGRKDRSYMLSMLEKYHALYPDDLRLLFYLGREYRFRNQWVAAREKLWEYVNRASWVAEKQEALMMIASIDDDPESWLWRAVALEPNRREPFVKLALLYEHEGRLDDARMMIHAARLRGDTTIYTTHREAWGPEFKETYNRLMVGLEW